MPRLDPEPDVKRVPFVFAPPKEGPWEADAAEKVVGQSRPISRLDGSVVDAEVVEAHLMGDGYLVATFAVPGGIDRAPKPPTEEQPA